MAVNDLKGISYAQGLVFNITDRICLGTIDAGWRLKPTQRNVELPFAHVNGSVMVPFPGSAELVCRFRQMTAQWLSALTGNSVATGALYYKKASFTASTTTITLTPVGTGVVDVIDITYMGDGTKRIIGGATVAGTTLTRSSATLTMHASDAGNGGVWEIVYLYADTAASDSKIIMSPTAFPGEVRLLLPQARVNNKTGAVEYEILDAQRCMPKVLPELGGLTPQEFLEFEMTFHVVNENSGDLVWYCNGYNPTY